MTQTTLLVFFHTLSTLSGAYDNDAGGRCLAPTSGHNYFHQSEGGSDGFLPRGMSGSAWNFWEKRWM
jgi:hypothetical protein